MVALMHKLQSVGMPLLKAVVTVPEMAACKQELTCFCFVWLPVCMSQVQRVLYGCVCAPFMFCEQQQQQQQ